MQLKTSSMQKLVSGREKLFSYHFLKLASFLKCLFQKLSSFIPRTSALFFRLKRELQALQQVMNKHIVCVYGWVKWPGSIGLVPEFMPGGNLTRFLDDEDCRSSLVIGVRGGGSGAATAPLS